MLESVVPATRKETGYWTENVMTGGHHQAMAGYSMKFFQEMSKEVSSLANPVTACQRSSSVYSNGGDHGSHYFPPAAAAAAATTETVARPYYKSPQEMRALGYSAQQLQELGFSEHALRDAFPAKLVDGLFSGHLSNAASSSSSSSFSEGNQPFPNASSPPKRGCARDGH